MLTNVDRFARVRVCAIYEPRGFLKMPNTRKLMLEKFGISEARYTELKGFCQQYFEKKEALNCLYSVSSLSYSEAAKGSAPVKPTETKALKALKYRKDIETIDKCLDYCSESSGLWLRNAMIDSVIKGKKFFELEIYCKPSVFYYARVKFFIKLDELKQ